MTIETSTNRAHALGALAPALPASKRRMANLLGVSFLVLGLAACAGGDDTAAKDGGGWWGWADPDAWYEGEGGEARAAESNVEGRAVPAGRLPREQAYGSADAGLGADTANANYSDEDVRGSGSGTVSEGGSKTIAAQWRDPDLTAPQAQGRVSSSDIAAGPRPLTGTQPGSTSLLSGYDNRVSAESDRLVSAADQMANSFPDPKFVDDLSKPAPSRAMQPNLLAGTSTPQLQMPVSGAVRSSQPSGSFDASFEAMTGRNIDTLPDRAARVQPVVPQNMVAAIDQELREPNMRYSDLQFQRPQQQMRQPQAYAPPAYQAPQQQNSMFAADTQQIPFLPGSVALSRTDRKKILAAAISHKQKGGRVIIVGYAADPSADRHGAISGHQLAMERANKVALALINAGVNPTSIGVEARADMGMRKADIFVN